MKPRTSQEREVYRLSQSLKPISNRQSRWAINAIEHIAHSTGKTQWCTACGEVMAHGVKTCPKCGTKLTIKVDNRRTDKDKYYAVVHTTCHGYQLARYYIVDLVARKGSAPNADIAEVVQEWLNVKTGTSTIMARDVCMHNWYHDLWNMSTPLTIKHRSYNYYDRSWRRYHIWSEVERWENLHPLLKRNGAQRHDLGVQPMELYHKLVTDPLTEELLKTQPKLLWSHIVDNNLAKYAHAVRICNRNGYIVQDGKKWVDYLGLLDKLGLDTHNAHYVCPQDLEQAHATMLARHMRNVERQRKEEERERKLWSKISKEQAEVLYKQLKAKYLAIYFGNDDIAISVAQSIEDIRQEGKHMHHCVYAREYYKKANSLILFARDKHNGKRIETIEIDLKNFRVAQSRGVCDKDSPQHDEIVRLCNENMHLIRKAAA